MSATTVSSEASAPFSGICAPFSAKMASEIENAPVTEFFAGGDDGHSFSTTTKSPILISTVILIADIVHRLKGII